VNEFHTSIGDDYYDQLLNDTDMTKKVSKMYGLENHSITGEDLRRAALESKRRIKEERVARVLHEAEEQMPAGQSWNLGSKAACDMLATKILEEIDGPVHE